MFTEKKITAGSLQLNLAIGPGSSPPLVFFHGVTRRWQDFLTLIPALAMRRRIHALDGRGHGRSDRAPGKYRVIDYTLDAVALLNDHCSEPAVLYGHSLGALVAAAAAALAPDRVRAAILEDPPFETLGKGIRDTPFFAQFAGMHALLTEKPAPGTVDQLAGKLADLMVPKPDGTGAARLGDIRDAVSLRFSARCLLDLDPGVLEPLIEGRWLEGYDGDGFLKKIDCPVLLLHGNPALGGMLPAEEAQRAAALIPCCTRIAMPRTGHLIHWLEPELTLRLVTGFLESL